MFRFRRSSCFGHGDHQLQDGELLTAVRLPPPGTLERSGWFRVSSRERAEWPLVETLVRLVLGPAGTVEQAAIALGGVANIPIRATALEAALVGGPGELGHLQRVAQGAGDLVLGDDEPVAATAYKVSLIGSCVAEAMTIAIGGQGQ